MKRTHIRRFAAAGALAVLLGSVSAMPAAAADDYIFRDGFESGAGDWKGHGSASVQTDTKHPYADSSALAVTGRADSWNGAEKSLKGICTPGETYSFSVCACYDSGPQTMEFMLSLVYEDADGKAVYDHLVQVETIAGFYVQLANDSYTIPAGASNPILYVETKSGTASFFIDDVICAEQGTKIDGPKPVKFTLGDADFDGVISAADLTVAKTYCGQTFPSKTVQRAADVDQSGTVDAADLQ